MQHLIERLTILAPNDRIDAEAVQDAISAMEPGGAAGETLAETEADQIRRVLAATGGNKSRAAAILGIERKTLYRKLERMKLVMQRFHIGAVTDVFSPDVAVAAAAMRELGMQRRGTAHDQRPEHSGSRTDDELDARAQCSALSENHLEVSRRSLRRC